MCNNNKLIEDSDNLKKEIDLLKINQLKTTKTIKSLERDLQSVMCVVERLLGKYQDIDIDRIVFITRLMEIDDTFREEYIKRVVIVKNSLLLNYIKNVVEDSSLKKGKNKNHSKYIKNISSIISNFMKSMGMSYQDIKINALDLKYIINNEQIVKDLLSNLKKLTSIDKNDKNENDEIIKNYTMNNLSTDTLQ